MADNCSVTKDVKCKKCNAVGRTQAACVASGQAKATDERNAPAPQNNPSLALEYQPESSQANYAMAFAGSGDHHSFPTHPENEASHIYVKCCPDTGATQTVIHESIARQAYLILKPPRIGMNSITGPMNIVGEANVVLKFDGLKHTNYALIARGMDFTCLIAWHDLQPLDIISNTFPARISASSSHDLTSSIVNDFPSVFVEKLSKSPMNVPEMKIHFTDPYVPYRVSTARQVPLRFQTMAERIVKDLVIAQVIELESEPTEWCAPAFFVPKGDGV